MLEPGNVYLLMAFVLLYKLESLETVKPRN